MFKILILFPLSSQVIRRWWLLLSRHSQLHR